MAARAAVFLPVYFADTLTPGWCIPCAARLDMDVIEANALLHGGETDVYDDAGYQGVAKCQDAKARVN